MAMTLSGPAAAIPDWRYAHAVQPAALGDMLGVGPRGLRWRQVAVVAATAWLAGNTDLLVMLAQQRVPVSSVNVSMTLGPLFFAVASVTSVRTFGNGAAVTLATAALYSLVITGYRTAVGVESPLPLALQLALPAVWAAFMMMAFQHAARWRLRWARTAVAIVLANYAASYVRRSLYTGTWDGAAFLQGQISFERTVSLASVAIIWTIGLRLAALYPGDR
jgi:hypothetical protein